MLLSSITLILIGRLKSEIIVSLAGLRFLKKLGLAGKNFFIFNLVIKDVENA